MNILRIIKLKQLNNEFDLLDDKDLFFLSLFNNTKTVEYYKEEFYYTESNVNFCYDINRKNFIYDSTCGFEFSIRYEMSEGEVNDYIKLKLSTILDIQVKNVSSMSFPSIGYFKEQNLI